ncbi:DUF6542 domain-containing protein [Umezawaea endophytica]|uniref:DUF6542 domain-containing protein n=1 Tax=Umezawaea endophytica TaxID=1654476 RepID=UPI0027E332A1|nr:DUF6542 domain-containing protein [Umezawaea endophytica]
MLAIIGTFIDVSSTKTVGWIFTILFFVGCVGAIVFVERRSMFGPVVQPPLILAIVVPLVVVVTEGMPATGGLSSLALTLGKPLINGFPTMAVTTVCTVLIGVARVVRQRDPNRVTRDEAREVKKADRAERADRGERSDRSERGGRSDRAERSERSDRAERAERPSRPVVKPGVEKGREDTGPRRRPAPVEGKRPAGGDEERRGRPRPAPQGERRRAATPPAERPSSPRQGGRGVPPRRPRPREDD